MQLIPTSGALDWEPFSIGVDVYLVVANHFDGITQNTSSKIYSAVIETGISGSSPDEWDDYTQLDTSNGNPPDMDCNEASEIGRMKVDSQTTNLYVCTASGWVIK